MVIHNHTGIDLSRYLPDFERWLQIHRGVSISSFRHHAYNIRLILRVCESLNENCIHDFLIKCKAEKMAGTIENYLYTLRVFCKFLETIGIMDLTYVKEIPLPKREKRLPNVLSVFEIEKILDTDLPHSYKHYPDPSKARDLFNTILSLLSKTGARIGEVLNTKINNIDWDEGIWKINLTKTRRGRLVPIPPDDLIRLKILAKDRKADEFLFVNPFTGRVVSQASVGENFRRRLRESKIQKTATIHTLRHSFITELMKQDVSVLKIASLAGHESIKTTQEYARLLYDDLREAILRHPMTAKNRNPHEILNHIKEVINKFHLKEDSRFFYELSEGNDGVRISIFVR